MDPIYVRRALANPTTERRRFVVKAITRVVASDYPVQHVSNVDSYEVGCTAHEACHGHICKAPNGCVLVPQSLAVTRSTVINEYTRAARVGFTDGSKRYIAMLTDMNKAKAGHMRRDILGGVVTGSARLIISPCTHIANSEVAVPRHIARTTRVTYTPRNMDTGLECQEASHRCVQEGDWCVVVRPPSLTSNSTQPMRVVLWDNSTLGISPYCVGLWHGDFDGDEMHAYFITSAESVAECESWQHERLPEFDTAYENFVRISPMSMHNMYALPWCKYTTVPLSIRGGKHEIPAFSAVSRLKSDTYMSTCDRFVTDLSTCYVEESLRGVRDICRQQLEQGRIGHMSRLSKIAASSFVRMDGSIHVQGSSGLQRLSSCPPSYGCPALRAVSLICAVAQQAALDSHRASSSSMLKFNMIENMLTGGTSTVVVMGKHVPHARCSGWSAHIDTGRVAIVTMEELSHYRKGDIVAAYLPWALRLAGDVRQACTYGCCLVLNYFDIRLSEAELYDLVSMLCYLIDHSNEPITTMQGICDRDLGWAESLMSSSYTALSRFKAPAYSTQEAVTVTSALVTGNFNRINGRAER